MSPFRSLPVLAACAALASLSNHAAAETLFGLTVDSRLVSFDSASPGLATSIGAITGLTSGQTLRNIDFRPSNGLLYGISSLGTAAQIYTLDTRTGAATAVGGALTLADTASKLSIDFNPVADVLRVVADSRSSYRVNADTGALIARDTSVNSNYTPVAIAYSNNLAGATQTTLYTYDYNNDFLATIGSVNGTPNSPNSGIVSVVGGSGFVAPNVIGFDISGATGTAYLSFNANNSGLSFSQLYTANLATGALTRTGEFNLQLRDIAVGNGAPVAAVPEPATLALMLGGLGVLGAAARRRRAR